MATASATSVFPLRRGATAAWRHIDLALLFSSVAISGMGVLMVFSATESKLREQGLDPHMYLKRQSVWMLLGLVVMAVIVSVDYRVLRDIAPVIFAGTFFLLLLVLSPLGSSTRGAQAWFQFGSFQLEPSEWAKLALIVCVSAYCATHRGDLDGRRLLTVLGLAAVPMALIYLQPDLGTDLVFTVVGEELGFVGAFTLLALFAVVVWRTWRTATLARDLFGTLLCVGVLAMFVFQIFENVGMTMGIMPITGIPLPFMSYGGSSTVANFAAVGLVLNVHMRRFA